MIKVNLCRYCPNSFDYKGKHYPCHKKCSNRLEHEKYLQSQRMFSEGEPITSIDELLKQEWVMWYHTTRHIEVIKSVPLRLVLKWLNNGALKKVIPNVKGEKNESI